MTDKAKSARNYLCASLGRYGETDGTEYLVGWIDRNPTFGADTFRAVIDEFCAKKEAAETDGRKWSRPSIRQIVRAYERRMSNKQRQDEFNGADDCNHCDRTGFVHSVLAGSTPFDARRVPRSRHHLLEPAQYAVSVITPCICSNGRRFKGRENWDEKRLSRIVSDFSAPGRVCDRVAYQMRGEGDCGRGLARRAVETNPMTKEPIMFYVRTGADDAAVPMPVNPGAMKALAAAPPEPHRYRDDDPSLVAADASDASDDWGIS